MSFKGISKNVPFNLVWTSQEHYRAEQRAVSIALWNALQRKKCRGCRSQGFDIRGSTRQVAQRPKQGRNQAQNQVAVPMKGTRTEWSYGCSRWASNQPFEEEQKTSTIDIEEKVLSKILKYRIERSTDRNLDNVHFGFRSGTSTVQVIRTLRRRIQQAREAKKMLILIFIVLLKAYGSVDRTVLFTALSEKSKSAQPSETHHLAVAWAGWSCIRLAKQVRARKRSETGVRNWPHSLQSNFWQNVQERCEKRFKFRSPWICWWLCPTEMKRNKQQNLGSLNQQVQNAGMEISLSKT